MISYGYLGMGFIVQLKTKERGNNIFGTAGMRDLGISEHKVTVIQSALAVRTRKDD